MKRTFSGLLALLLLLTLCAGCGNGGDQDTDAPSSGDADKGIFYDITGIDPQETALEYKGLTIPAEMYFYWLGYACSYVEYQINMFNAYGMYTDLINEDGSIVWDGALDETTPNQYAGDSADSNALSYLVLEDMAAEYGVTLTDEDKADMENTLAQQIEEAGGEEVFQQSLKEMGIGRESFDRIAAAGYLLDHLQELAADPSSSLYEAPDEVNNAYVDHILIGTTDAETGDPLSEEDVQAKRGLAEDLLARLQAAEDVQALFDELVAEYGEDPGREANAGYLVDPTTSFVPEFLEATFALKPGELSGIVESDYGYHILLRKELTEDHLYALAGDHLTDMLTERMDTALTEMTRSEKLDGIVPGDFYNKYIELMEQLHPADSADGSGDAE